VTHANWKNVLEIVKKRIVQVERIVRKPAFIRANQVGSRVWKRHDPPEAGIRQSWASNVFALVYGPEAPQKESFTVCFALRRY
jgi:hypothetical protein